jgi:crossover junction endodeoxyribonuclease RuvC
MFVFKRVPPARCYSTRPVIVLGLDPGSLHTGYGVIERQGSRLTVIGHGRISLPKALPLPARFAQLAAELRELVERYRPGAAAVEAPFYGRNVRSLIVLAEARGALLATLSAQGLQPREYSPAEIKVAVTGNGRAEKEQVARMVRVLLSMGSAVLSRDATDALAVALCCAQRERLDRLAN